MSAQAYVTSEEYKNVTAFGYGKFNNVPNQDGGWSTASFASFILKVLDPLSNNSYKQRLNFYTLPIKDARTCARASQSRKGGRLRERVGGRLREGGRGGGQGQVRECAHNDTFGSLVYMCGMPGADCRVRVTNSAHVTNWAHELGARTGRR